MPERFSKPHLNVNRFSESASYRYPSPAPIRFRRQERDRNTHGRKLREDLNSIRSQFEINKETALPEGIVREDAIYVEFYSGWGYELKFESLNDNRRGRPKFQLLSIQKEINEEESDETKNFRYKVLVMLTEGGVSHFLDKVNKFLTEETASGNPASAPLICNIEEIQLATLEGFWTDTNFHEFPEPNEVVWWEVWMRSNNLDETKVLTQLQSIDATIGTSRLEFAENVVILVKASANQLSNSLMLLDSLSELRKPQELSDFIIGDGVSYSEQEEWLQDLQDRTDNHLDSNSVLVCLLDTGVNNGHPLLSGIIPTDHLYAWKPEWGVYDSEPRGGHGTGMAGLALYGDLTDALATPERVQLYHGVESFKLKHPSSATEKELYGRLYQDACNTPVVDRPSNPRVYCLSVTNSEFVFYGRPSSSSAAVDNIAFGSFVADGEPQLMIVSGGNVHLNNHPDYPDQNFLESVEDPGQSYNALTVGSFTRKDRLQDGATGSAIAPYGGMAPSNSTSAAWEAQWPNKPDIVMEGGNLETDGVSLSHNDLLKPLSLDADVPNYLFLPFDGTSCASALASKMAAELKTEYPDYWPETIRGLMVHSADWTDAMRAGVNLNSESGRRSLLRSVGYGVPNLNKARESANNSLTLISETRIKPFRIEGSSVKYNEYHLYSLPWPTDVLLNEVAEGNARITVTLSYFIEPNPGNRQYARAYSYHSHELDFKLIKPGEGLTDFKRRISSAAEGTDDETTDLTTEEWTIRRVRNKGSIKKDYLDTSGAELADRKYLAVYPKGGWYRTRKKLNKYESEVRYSLIVTIETESQEVDIYTPVENLIAIELPSS